MSKPANQQLYGGVKKECFQQYPAHSAHRNGLLVKTYTECGGEYIGRGNKSSGFTRWLDDKWTNQRGEVR